MIEGKYFREFLSDQTHWLPASVQNNVLGEGKGILTTVGEIVKGHINAQVRVEYIDNNGHMQNFQSSAQFLKDMPLVEIILDIVRKKPQNSDMTLTVFDQNFDQVGYAQILRHKNF